MSNLDMKVAEGHLYTTGIDWSLMTDCQITSIQGAIDAIPLEVHSSNNNYNKLTIMKGDKLTVIDVTDCIVTFEHKDVTAIDPIKAYDDAMNNLLR